MRAHPIIGIHYSGPQLDRAIRRMPRHWVLEEPTDRTGAWPRVIGLACAVAIGVAFIAGLH